MSSKKKFFVAAIGFSAGGLQDLYDFFSYLPKLPDAAFIVIQHLNRNHASIADVLLSQYTDLPVTWAVDHQRIEPNHIYLLPPNKYMTMENGYLKTRDRDPLDRSNRAVDIFFSSMAEEVNDRAIGIVLSGAGSDGASGAVRIHEKGGMVMAQDPNTALFDGMPLSTIIKDSPDAILSPRKLAYALAEYLTEQQSV
jgi:two-component system chemotaxis response regulator CheB